MRCSKCKRQTKTEAFATYKDSKGQLRRRGICKECRGKYATENFERLQKWRREYNGQNKNKKHESDRIKRAAAKAFVDEYKSSHPCADCGRHWPPVAMDLDHVRGSKIHSIASMVSSGYNLTLIKVEIEKCEVVCACCHRIRTAGRGENRSPPTRETRTTRPAKYRPRGDVPSVQYSEAPAASH